MMEQFTYMASNNWSLFMGSITRSFANNIGSSGILTASAVTNTTIEDVTSFDNAASAEQP
jgi:hypothetical protein